MPGGSAMVSTLDPIGVATAQPAHRLDHSRSEHRQELVGRMAATILHEMRNPLTVIKSYAELIAHDQAFAQDRRVESLLQGVNRLDTVMECVLSMMHAPADPQVSGDVTKSLRLARDFLLIGYRPKPVVTLDIPDGLPPARIASTDLELVLLNLLTNAADASAPHPTVFVKVSAERCGPPPPAWGAGTASSTPKEEWARRWSGGTAVVIRIRDFGLGIAKDVMGSLFAEQITTKKQKSGTGLGLLLCQDLMERCGGSLVLESTFGVGTTATVVLPTAAAPATCVPVGSHGYTR